MKRSLVVLLVILLGAVFALSGCTEADEPAPTETFAVTTEAVADVVDENGAKAIALEDAGIPETAANNLVVTTGKVDGAKVYVVAFDWSGFDYQYTISAATGEIVETIFDGEVLE